MAIDCDEHCMKPKNIFEKYIMLKDLNFRMCVWISVVLKARYHCGFIFAVWCTRKYQIIRPMHRKGVKLVIVKV